MAPTRDFSVERKLLHFAHGGNTFHTINLQSSHHCMTTQHNVGAQCITQLEKSDKILQETYRFWIYILSLVLLYFLVVFIVIQFPLKMVEN